MPTRGGWSLAVSSVVVGVGGRLLGVRELFVLAAGGVTLLGCALAYVWLRRFAVDGRRLVPARLPAGGSGRVELTLTNRGARPTPLLEADDGGPWRFLLTPLGAGDGGAVSYVVAAGRRGLLHVGPLRVRLRDPFGLASRVRTVLEASTVTVHPRVEPVAPASGRPGLLAAGGAPRVIPSVSPGGDFHALRPYEEGDDLRLVHWPTSARLDSLVVRQDEVPGPRHTTVILDVRRSVHDAVTLERAVSAAASVAAAALLDDDGLGRLVTTGAVDTGWAGGDAQLETVLDELAVVDGDAAADLAAAVAAVDDGNGGTVVLVTTGASPPGDLDPVARVADQHGSAIAVLFHRADVGRRSPARAEAWPVGFERVVDVPPGGSFPSAWDRAHRAATAGA